LRRKIESGPLNRTHRKAYRWRIGNDHVEGRGIRRPVERWEDAIFQIPHLRGPAVALAAEIVELLLALAL
jgi:hypothetical protein